VRGRAITHEDIPASYEELARLVMPRPIRDEVDYRNALEVLDALAGFEMNADQEDYFEAVSTFVEKYEAEHQAIETRRLSPVEMLHYLVEEHGMTESDLGRLLGDRSLGHRVLTGERSLSKAHIRRLADHFAVSPSVFL